MLPVPDHSGSPQPRPWTTMDELYPGMVLEDRYMLQWMLGRGGMSQVWLAQDLALGGALVAVKLLLSLGVQDPQSVEEFKQEAAILLHLSHPNICRLFNIETRNRIFIVMEYVQGSTLDRWLDALERQTGHRWMTEAQLMPLAEQMAAALDYTHAQRLIHRDIKPSNVAMTSERVCKLLDFGIARQVKGGTIHVRDAGRAGTLPYMSPEQYYGDALTVATDVYSLAATFYECLCGHPPFHEDNIVEQILKRPPPWIEGVSRQTNRALQAGLAKFAKDRPKSAGELVRMMGRHRSPGRLAQSRRLAVAALMVVAVGLIGLIAWVLVQEYKRQPQDPGKREPVVIAPPEQPPHTPAPPPPPLTEPHEKQLAAAAREGAKKAGADTSQNQDVGRLWKKAVADQEEAQKAFDASNLGIARKGWGDAASGFDKAKEGAEAATQEGIATAARNAAQGAKADKNEDSNTPWTAAEGNNAQARTRFDQKDFVNAKKLWALTATDYGKAKAQADEDHKQASGSQQAATAAAKSAQDSGVDKSSDATVAELWTQGEKSRTDAANLSAKDNYSQARKSWDGAKAAYELALHANLAAVQRSASDAARKTATEANADNDDGSKVLFETAKAGADKAQVAFADKRYDEAKTGWMSAAKGYLDAEKQAKQDLGLATAAQKQAKEEAAKVKDTADPGVKRLWDGALALSDAGEAQFKDGNYSKATQSWQEAVQKYAAAGQAELAVRNRAEAQKQVAQHQQAAEKAMQEARQAKVDQSKDTTVKGLWDNAVALEKKASDALQANDAASAIALWDDAARICQLAQGASSAVAERLNSGNAMKLAGDAKADRDEASQARYKQGRDNADKANQAFAAGKYVDARNLWAAAVPEFQAAEQQAKSDLAAAEQSRKKAEEAMKLAETEYGKASKAGALTTQPDVQTKWEGLTVRGRDIQALYDKGNYSRATSEWGTLALDVSNSVGVFRKLQGPSRDPGEQIARTAQEEAVKNNANVLARETYRQGMESMTAGRWDDARGLFERALRLASERSRVEQKIPKTPLEQDVKDQVDRLFEQP